MIDITGITPIEKAFYRMGKTDPKSQEYFFTYYSQKLVLLNRFYPHVESMIPGFTDHGPEHIVRLMKLYGKMLKNNVPGLSNSREVVQSTAFNFYEIYLLLCGTVWHDVGNLLGREKHNRKIIEVANRLRTNFFVDKHMEIHALQIAEAHTEPDGVRRTIPVEDVNYRNEEINLQFLGAILRFADELDEGDVRVDETYYKTMKDRIQEPKRIHWETSCCIKRITPDPTRCIIEVHAKTDRKQAFQIFKKDGNNVALIDELVCRIDKMNRERMYYMRFVRKHIEYRRIVFELTVENSKFRKFTFDFDNHQGYDDFWYNCSQINPEENIKNYTLQGELTDE